MCRDSTLNGCAKRLAVALNLVGVMLEVFGLKRGLFSLFQHG